MLVCDLLPSHILLTRLVYRLLPGVAATDRPELAKRRMRSHVRELARAVFWLALMTCCLLVRCL